MNIIKIEGREVIYPVGLHMDKAISYIKKVAFILNSIDDEKTINLFCTGSSGAILSSLLYSQLIEKDIKISHIKKDGEVSHIKKDGEVSHIKKDGEVSHSDDIYYRNQDINIIIDDFACTGDTLNKIYKKISEDLIDARIDYLILSGMNSKCTKILDEFIKPINFIITQQGIDNIEEYREDQKTLAELTPATDLLETEIPL